MRTRTKVVITVFSIVYFVFCQHFCARERSALPSHLHEWYSGFNSEYFDDKLPKNVIIDWTERDKDAMASTYNVGGQFHIALNPNFVRADRTAWLTLLHESCHIENWAEAYKDEHGPLWRACMLRLEIQGANRRILIDGYTE